MKKLGLTFWKTSIRAQTIDDSILKIYDKTLARFLLQDSLKKIWFFKEIFLLADISMKIILEILSYLFVR